jgi:hypothetical protein
MANQKNASTSTMYLLMAEYGARIMIPLEDLAFKVLGMSVNPSFRTNPKLYNELILLI